MGSVDLKAVFEAGTHNEVDLLLIEIARKDGDLTHLSSNDFIRSVGDQAVDAYLSVSEKYLSNRTGDEKTVEAARLLFLEGLKALKTLQDLPFDYKPASTRTQVPNPFERSPLDQVKFGLLGGYSLATASGSIQNQKVEWGLSGKSLGVMAMIRADAVKGLKKLDWVHVGLLSTVSELTGEMSQNGNKLSDVKMLDGSLSIYSYADVPVTSWLKVLAGVGYGFEVGHVSSDRTTAGKKLFKDACTVEAGDIIADPDKATNAVSCRIKEGIGTQYVWPLIVTGAVRLFDIANVGVMYKYFSSIEKPSSIDTPTDAHEFNFFVGL